MQSTAVESQEDRRHRKRRTRRSCGPCRARKVKCDHASPCRQCVKSSGVLRCTYDEETTAITSSDPVVDRAEVQQDEQHRLGANSLPTFLNSHGPLPNASGEATNLSVCDAILPMLGLTTPATGNLFYSPDEDAKVRSFARLNQSLPSNRQIIKLFRIYQVEVHPYVSILPRVLSFEAELCDYMQSRTFGSRKDLDIGQNQDLLWGKSMPWVSTLFAVLACGTQFSGDKMSEIYERCGLYVSCSLEALRTANFLVQPTVLCVQAMLLIGHVLQNDMKPHAAWTLLGTTMRMAQSLGFHKVRDANAHQRLLWLAIVRQDSLLALCFDQASASVLTTTVPLASEQLSYQTAMDHLSALTLQSGCIAAELQPRDFASRLSSIALIDSVRLRTNNQHVDAGEPDSIRKRCEAYHLDLQFAFVKAWLCRPSLRKLPNSESLPPMQLRLVEMCLQSLRECLHAFNQLYPICNYASRSWSVIHNGLSSALLLALLGQTTSDRHLYKALGELLDMFPLDQEDSTDGQRTVKDATYLSAPHLRAVAALRKMYLADLTSFRLSQPNETLPGCTGVPWCDTAYVADHTRPTNDFLDQGPASYLNIDTTILEGSSVTNGIPPLDAFDSIVWPSDLESGLYPGAAQNLMWF